MKKLEKNSKKVDSLEDKTKPVASISESDSESGMDPKVDDQLQPSNKEISVAELFEKGTKVSESLKAITEKIQKDKETKSLMDSRINLIKSLLAPVPRSVKKSKTQSQPKKLSSEERKLLKIEGEVIKNERRLMIDTIVADTERLNRMVGIDLKKLKIQQKVNKASSHDYMKRNKGLISSKLLKVINEILANKAKETTLVKKLAKDISEVGKNKFKDEFKNILDKWDTDLFILLSGPYGSIYFDAAQLTISKWDKSKKLPIKSLQFPENKSN